MNTPNITPHVPGQLNDEERRLLTNAILESAKKPEVVVEVGTWLGGGSTLHLLRALEHNGKGQLWGIEVDRIIYTQMLKNIRSAAPEAVHRFTPMFGCSQDVLRNWLTSNGSSRVVDLAFLDGGNNPKEQIVEFRLLDPHIPVGGQLWSHDAKLRKGKWLLPYLSCLDNWRVYLHQVSEVGLLEAKKIADAPSASSKRKAAMRLLRLRLNPIELAASFLPSKVCGFFLSLLPKKFARRLSDGC